MADVRAIAALSALGSGVLVKASKKQIDEYLEDPKGMSIRVAFRIAIAVIAALAFTAIITLSYLKVSKVELEQAQASVSSEINYLCLQLDSLKNRSEAFSRVADASGVTKEELAAANPSDLSLLSDPIGDVLQGYTLAETGTVLIARDDAIVATDDERMPVGGKLQELLGQEAYAAIETAQKSGKLQEIVLDGALKEAGNKKGYLLAGKQGDCNVVIVEPASRVYRDRLATMRRETTISLGVLLVVFLVVDRLLIVMVAQRIDKTNAALRAVVEGNLDARVPVEGASEFCSLARGINVTTDALQGWIAEAESRMDAELATARAIQRGALPSTLPAFADEVGLDLFAAMDPAREVGGDFYDYFEIDDHTVGFLIADVSGKGIPGALFMMVAKNEIEHRMRKGHAPAEAIASANAHLCANNDAGMFVTLWAATYDFTTGVLTYVNAGHNPPLLRRNGQWEWLTKKCGLFLGTFDTAKYREETLTLEPGDELLLYTDGVNEAFSVNEVEYGNERLERFLVAHDALAPAELVPALRADVAQWAEGAEQSDDVTIMALEVKQAF